MSFWDRPGVIESDELRSLRERAARNDPDALCTLAMHYRDGARTKRGRWLVRPDAALSLRLFRRAAELGDATAMCELANALSPRPFRTADLRAAMPWYVRSFRHGNATAAENAAMTYRNVGRRKEAVAWLRRAATAGDDSALLPLARAELLGCGTRRNVPAALKKLQRVASSRGVSQLEQEQAMLLLADLYREGWLVRFNFDTALEWLRRAAATGSAAAAGLLCDLGEEREPEAHSHRRGRKRSRRA